MRQFSDLPQDDGSRRFQRCPPSLHEMALTPHLAQASARAPRPSRPTPPSPVSSAQVSPSQQRGSTMPPDPPAKGDPPAPLASHPPHRSMVHRTMGGDRTRARSYDHSCGSLAPTPTSFGASTPTYSPHHHVNMGGGNSPTARTPTPLVGVTPSSHPTDIVEWAARACPEDVSEDAHEILAYWDAHATPHEQSLFWATNAGPPLSSRPSIRERLLANARTEVRRAQWVRSYLAAMSTSPSHPHRHKGGRTGPMAPTPVSYLHRCQAHRRARRDLLLRLLVRRRLHLHNKRSLRLLPLQQFHEGGEQAWQSIEPPPSFSVGSGASGFVAGSTSRLY